MITVRPGSHTHRLLHLLSTTREVPTSVLSLLGNERVIASLVHKLELVQDFRVDKNGPVLHIRLLQVSGRRAKRTIRLSKRGLPVLEWLYSGSLNWYLSAYKSNNVSGDQYHIWRNHRVAEALAMCMMADVEIRPYALPALQKAVITKIIPNQPCFYAARDLKRISDDGANKTMFTRVVGALLTPGRCYAVYNTRDAVMKWSGQGEVKTVGHLLELVRMNARLNEVSRAILFGKSAQVALDTILESDKSRRADLRFDKIFKTLYFVPLNQFGIRLLKLLILPDWNEQLLSALFNPTQRSYNRGTMEYDAVVDGRMILSHLDGDIARLIRFREALNSNHEPADVLCYPWQTEFLRAYLGKRAGIRELEMEAVESVFKEEERT